MKQGWKESTLGKVCLIKPPKQEVKKRLSDNDLVSFVPMSNLGIYAKELVLNENKPLDEVYGSYTYFANKDVLLAKITPCFENGKLGIASGLTNGVGFGSSEYIVLRSQGEIDPEFLFYFLSQDSFREAGTKLMTGAVGHKRVPNDFVENYPILYPNTIDKQKRVVKILDEAFEKIDKAIAITKKNLTNAHEFFESYLNNIFSQKSDDWEEASLDRYIKFIDYRGKTPTKVNEGLRLITAKNVRMGFLQEEPKEFVDSDIYKTWMTRGVPKKEDVLFTTEAPLGLVCQLDTDEKVVFAQRIIILQPDRKILNPSFLSYMLRSNIYQKLIGDKSTGATAQGIKASLLKKIIIYFPDIDTQNMISKQIFDVLNATQTLEQIYLHKLNVLSELKQSLLKKAFSGEL